MRDLSNENVIHIKKDDCEYLQFRRLLEYNDVIKHAYGLKPANFNLDIDNDNYTTIETYKKLCDCIGADYNKLIRPNQTHTNVVKNVDIIEKNISIEELKYKETDGLITNKSGVTLASTNADCILLLFFDPVKKVIANVHSGWKGTFQKIAINTVKEMIKKYESNPKDIICCICPSIRKCHFEVEKEVKEMCENIFSYTNKTEKFIEYIGKKDGKDKWVIDTVYINKLMLEEAGLLSENIVDSGICSVCNSDKIHSYRVEGKGFGRGSAVISLK
ncbi:MAG: peptidoglycan editing factor PgeF [Clostridia bacterium]|nr:peptidoglycan editing factor PgeF [Clostridia bacterium]